MSTIVVSGSTPAEVSVTIPQVNSISVTPPEVRSVSVSANVPSNARLIPTGGAEGVILRKDSVADYDVEWTTYSFPLADGDDGQVLTTDGAGTISFSYPKTISEDVKNVSGGTLTKGTPVHVTGSVGNLAEVIAADAATNYPAHFVLNEDLADDAEGLGIALGFINNVDVPDASIYNEGDTVYLGASGGFTTTKPTGASNAIQNLGIIIKVNVTGGGPAGKISGIIMGAGRSNDVPNIPEGYVWIGDASGVAQPTLLSSISSSQNFSNTNLTVTGDRTHNLATNDVNFVQSSGGTSTMYLDGNNARVGINTTTPGRPLHIAGTGPLVRIGNVEIDADGNFTSKALSSPSMAFKATDDTKITVQEASPGTITFDVLTGTGATETSTEVVRILGTTTADRAYVGIGTTTPSSNLHVVGDVRVEGDLTVNGSYTQIDTDVLTTEQWNVTNDGTGPAVTINQKGAQDIMDVQDDGVSVFYIEDGGNVGIGTTSPTSKLDVNGGVTASGPIESSDGTNTSLTSETARFNKFGVMANRSSMYITNENASGSMQFGIGGVHAANTKMYLSSAGRLGVGTTSPSEKLEVAGNVILDSSDARIKIKGGVTGTNSGIDWTFNTDATQYAKIELDYDTRNTTGLLIDSGYPMTLDYSSGAFSVKKNGTSELTVLNGNVGIGTTSPVSPLHVYSDNAITGTSGGLTIEQDGTGDALLQFLLTASKRWVVGIDNDNNNNFKISGTSDLGTDNGLTITNNTYNVGIGTQSPAYKLDVNAGTENNVASFESTDDTAQIRIIDSSSTPFYFGVKATNAYISATGGTPQNGLAVTSTGDVGIGNSSPAHKLHVAGGAKIEGALFVEAANNQVRLVDSDSSGNFSVGVNTHFQIRDVAGNTTPVTIQSGTPGGTLFLKSDGNIGIGTSNPSYALDIEKDTTSILNLYRPNSSTAAASFLDFSFNTANATESVYARIRADVETNTDLAQGGDLSFHTANNGTVSEKLRITQQGNVGIGTTSPDRVLHARASAIVSTKLEGTNQGHLLELVNSNASPTYNGIRFDHGSTSKMAVTHIADGTTKGYVQIGNSWDAGYEILVVDGRTSRVGIGTTSPSAKLDVAGLANINDGSDNVMISSGNTAMTTGINNTAVGYQAALNNSTGEYNTACGYHSMRNATSSVQFNTALGSNSARNVTGNANTAIGHEASFNGGAGNTSIGWRAGKNAVNYNVSVGYGAASNTTGTGNTVIGYNAAIGGATSNFDNTVAVGREALFSLTTGQANTAAGYQAGSSMTSGSSNVLLGYGALTAAQGASNNVAIGRAALKSNVSGGQNIAIGRTAGHNTTGSGNVFIGYGAGFYETGSNKLYIANTDTTTPLIYGEFDNEIVNVNGKLKPNSITVDDEGLSAAGDYGPGAEIWYQGTSTPSAGFCYYLDSTGGWTSAQANAVGTATGMLAVSAGTDSDVDGMVLRGFVQISNTLTGSVGDAVYLETSAAGRFTTTKPTGAGNFVRRVGYLAKGTNVIYFNPSPEWEAL